MEIGDLWIYHNRNLFIGVAHSNAVILQRIVVDAPTIAAREVENAVKSVSINDNAGPDGASGC